MGEVGYEGRSTIADYFFWKSMMMPDVLQEQLGDSGRVQGGDCGYGVNPLRQAIHHHKDGIVPPWSPGVLQSCLWRSLASIGQGPCWRSASPPSALGRSSSGCMHHIL